MKPSIFKKRTNICASCLKSIITLAAMVGSAYALAENCPDMSQITASNQSGAYVYTSGGWRGTNEDTGNDEDKSYLGSGLKFDRATLSQRVIQKNGEDPQDQPGAIISFVKCDYVGPGANDRVRLSKRYAAVPTPANGTWDSEKINGVVVKNTANTENKYCTSTSVTGCAFN